MRIIATIVLLLAAGLAGRTTAVPWLSGKKLRLTFGE